MLLNSQWVTEEIEEDIKKTNNNENTMTQSLWDAAKADLRGKSGTRQSTSRNKKKLTYQFNLTLKATIERTEISKLLEENNCEN